MLIKTGNLGRDFRPWHRADGKVLGTPFAFDVETPRIVAHEVPDYVLGAATDSERGFFIPPSLVFDFLQAHWGQEIVFHHCPFDLAVIDALLISQGRKMDIYALVDEQKVWDTQIMHRLYSLATYGHTCQGAGQSTLDACASRYLGIAIPKSVRDTDGGEVRTSWGKWSGRPARDIPPIYLDYLGRDVLATFECWRHLSSAVSKVLEYADEAWGHVDHAWLERVSARFGPLTHGLQVMAAVALEEIERVGFGLDLVNRNEIMVPLQQHCDKLREEIRRFGYLDGEKGCQKALQALIRQALQQNPGIEIPRTPKSANYSVREEDLDQLAEASEFFAYYKEFLQARAVLNFLSKMNAEQIHPHYDLLKNTGRTSSSNPNIQGFPKRKRKKGKLDFDIRRCFVPRDGNVFYIADYASVELRTLSQALKTQFKLDSQMANAINAGTDVHRLVAARMKATSIPNAADVLADPSKFDELMASVTGEERNAAKPANFGLPAGMGTKRLKSYASVQFGQAYTEEDAHGWKEAWLASFPEMREFLKDNFDAGLALAHELDLTPGALKLAKGECCIGTPGESIPTGWLGGMALKVLRDSSPVTSDGTAYAPEILDYFWTRVQGLCPVLKPRMAEAIRNRTPSADLAFAVKRILDRIGVFTITGRLRARASYSARRNTVFQGAAADGAKLALFRLWRAGFRVVAFIHDEVVVEVPATVDLTAVKQQIDEILINAMQEICPNIRIEVEGAFHRRWSKDKSDEIPLTVPQPSTILEAS